LELNRNGELQKRKQRAISLLEQCKICPRVCRINRLNNEIGKCRTGRNAIIASYGPHFGEEPPLVGSHGSGTVFFSNCNLQCVFCQNYSISQLGDGKAVSKEELSSIMLHLQNMGCHNINLVSPSHVVPHIIESLEIAIKQGLHLPIVYNTGGYDKIETLKLLDGIVDIYMPDMKYSDDRIARELSVVGNYSSTNQAAVKEMYRQVGDLKINVDGIATRGLLIRHLVLPGHLSGSEKVLEFVAREISQNTYLNIMDQYHPCHKAREHNGLNRPVSRAEFRYVLEFALRQGLTRLDDRHALNIKKSVIAEPSSQ
jgi:putative pyruvate formate lyase activating enzyme